MLRFIKWVYYSLSGEWYEYWCAHISHKGEPCTRLECHPGMCRDKNDENFWP